MTATVINKRLKSLVPGAVFSSQCGFRPKVRARVALYAIQQLLNEVKRSKIQALVALVDFNKAFHSIAKDWLISALEEHHVHADTMR